MALIDNFYAFNVGNLFHSIGNLKREFLVTDEKHQISQGKMNMRQIMNKLI